MAEKLEGEPGLLLSSQDNTLVRCEELLGKKFLCFHGESEKVVISCRDGCYTVGNSNDTQLFWQQPLRKVAAGKNFLIGVSMKNTLYSWGVEGDNGQLGQGASVKKVFEPMEISYKAEFVDISCGEAFSVAVDSRGFAYSWGEVSIFFLSAPEVIFLYRTSTDS
jgi:hypothetical protein